MILDKLSMNLPKYNIIPITENEYMNVYNLQKKNTHYFSVVQEDLSYESCVESILELPPNTDLSQKHFIGFYNKGQLEAVMDYVEGYPTSKIVWIGLLMIDVSVQKCGVGSNIVRAFSSSAHKCDFSSIRLGVIEPNISALQFWTSHSFIELDKKPYPPSCNNLNVIIMEKKLI